LAKLWRKPETVITGSLVLLKTIRFIIGFCFPSGNSVIMTKTFVYAFWRRQGIREAIKVNIEYMGWKICPLICYDLRFHKIYADDYDLLIYVAS
jgi:predicted amidohydrolase